jgi:uncharacterized protein YfdQ (DUF2303 family)
MNTGTTEAGAIAALAKAAAKQPQTIEINGRHYLVKPDGMTFEEILDPHGFKIAKPARVRAQPALVSKDALTEYGRRFKTESSVVFADPASDCFHAIFDYHASADEPGFGDHRASLMLQRSEQWARWTKYSGHLIPQEDFAIFLQENLPDISEPDGATILELAQDMSAKTEIKFRRAVRRSTGDIFFEYGEETAAKSKSGEGLEVPSQFQLSIPVYYGEPTTTIAAWLRYKIDGGALKFGYELHRPLFVQQAVFEQIALDIGSRLDSPVYMGRSA